MRILAALVFAATLVFAARAGAQALVGFDADEVTGVPQPNFNLLTKPGSAARKR